LFFFPEKSGSRGFFSSKLIQQKTPLFFFSFTHKKKHFQQLTREAAMAVVRDTRVVAAFAEVCKFEQDADTVRGVYFFYF
jgi:hypothetical protein